MDPQQYKRIGAGSCGSIWVFDPWNLTWRSNTVIKVEDGTRTPGHLHNDCLVNTWIWTALYELVQGHGIELDGIMVPKAMSYNHPRVLPVQDKDGSRPNTFKMERIHPVSVRTRCTYVQLYYSHLTLNQQQVALKASEDCLIRVYLGKKGPTGRTNKRMFSMKNPPLYWPEAVSKHDELGIPNPVTLAGSMGKILALLHWMVGVDANDVEFVLGMSPKDADKGEVPTLWLLDFDCCREMDASEAGVKQAIEAYWLNDPYFPRPGSEWERGWNVFKGEYLSMSQKILMTVKGIHDPVTLALPYNFIAGIKKAHADNEQTKRALDDSQPPTDKQMEIGEAGPAPRPDTDSKLAMHTYQYGATASKTTSAIAGPANLTNPGKAKDTCFDLSKKPFLQDWDPELDPRRLALRSPCPLCWRLEICEHEIFETETVAGGSDSDESASSDDTVRALR